MLSIYLVRKCVCEHVKREIRPLEVCRSKCERVTLLYSAAGGSSGLGKECARTLAKRGAHVVLAARRADVLQDVKSLIIAETPTARVECMPLDLTDLKSVRRFTEEFKQKKKPLNILM